jgi:hypothetical protein
MPSVVADRANQPAAMEALYLKKRFAPAEVPPARPWPSTPGSTPGSRPPTAGACPAELRLLRQGLRPAAVITRGFEVLDTRMPVPDVGPLGRECPYQRLSAAGAVPESPRPGGLTLRGLGSIAHRASQCRGPAPPWLRALELLQRREATTFSGWASSTFLSHRSAFSTAPRRSSTRVARWACSVKSSPNAQGELQVLRRPLHHPQQLRSASAQRPSTAAPAPACPGQAPPPATGASPPEALPGRRQLLALQVHVPQSEPGLVQQRVQQPPPAPGVAGPDSGRCRERYSSPQVERVLAVLGASSMARLNSSTARPRVVQPLPAQATARVHHRQVG